MTKKISATDQGQDAATFTENYKQLNEIARTLRMQEEPDIDALVPMVETATQAYKVCKQRIEEVKLALKEHFKEGQE
jgi:exodeoxyribonuclease VII small subunit